MSTNKLSRNKEARKKIKAQRKAVKAASYAANKGSKGSAKKRVDPNRLGSIWEKASKRSIE